MKIDFTQKLYKFNGEPLVEIRVNEKGEQKTADKDLTLLSAAVIALLETYPDERNLPVKEKLERGELASKVFNSDADGLDLNAEEIALIKKLIGKCFGVLIVWQTNFLLENKPPKIKPKPKAE